jgi:hypothetical protein
MSTAGHGYSRESVRDSLSYGRAITESRVAAAAVAMEPASPARRGPTIGCDAPSAVAVCCSSRESYYVVRDAARTTESRREGPAAGNLPSFSACCFGDILVTYGS